MEAVEELLKCEDIDVEVSSHLLSSYDKVLTVSPIIGFNRIESRSTQI